MNIDFGKIRMEHEQDGVHIVFELPGNCTIGELFNTMKSFCLACGFHPTQVAELFSEED